MDEIGWEVLFWIVLAAEERRIVYLPKSDRPTNNNDGRSRKEI